MSNVLSTVAETIQVTTPTTATAYRELTLESPEVAKAVASAASLEDAAYAKWVTAAVKLYGAGVRPEHIAEATRDEVIYNKVRALVVQAQKANIVALLNAKSTLGFTDQERELKTYYKNRVDNVHMKRIEQHLAKIEKAEKGGGASVKKTMGERGAKMCSDWIASIQKAKPEKIDFDATEAIETLRELKKIFLS